MVIFPSLPIKYGDSPWLFKHLPEATSTNQWKNDRSAHPRGDLNLDIVLAIPINICI